MHEAHELKGEDGRLLDIVHRDISPHNLLVSTKGVAKVIDFGIAKARDRMAGETNAGVLKGKIQYMAPEQALGRKVDRRADLWAVGASLYHLLTGKPPYDADNTLGTLHLLTSGRPPLPLPPSVHPSVAAIARKALTSSVDARFETAAEMRDAIEAAMIDAKIPTTAADVAAFVIAHLAERTVKRRQVIDIALAAAAERQRIEEVLKPLNERTGSGLTSAGPDSGRTVADAPGALRVDELRDQAPPMQTPSSQQTPLGTVASTGAFSDVIEVPRLRRGMVIGAVMGVGFALAVGVAFVAMRPASPVAARPGAPSAVQSSTPVPSASAVASGTAPEPSASSSSIPEFSAGDLPRAGMAQATAVAAPGRVWHPPPPATTNAPPVPTTPRKRSVDDGF